MGFCNFQRGCGCIDFECPDGQRCVANGRCEPEDGPGGQWAPCVVGEPPCAEGLECVFGSYCEIPCEGPEDCPDGQGCFGNQLTGFYCNFE